MKPARWTWATARATGTSHIKAGTCCDDFGACVELQTGLSSVLLLVVSDGAGSAIHSSIGSRLAVHSFARSAMQFIQSGASLEDLSPKVAGEWLDSVRDSIGAAAERISATRRDFAATLVGCLIAGDAAAFVHVGDGSAVFKSRGSDEWTVASWPSQGEYAATTYFVTDDPEPRCHFTYVSTAIDQIAVFSDGIERLVLDFATESAFQPFFNRMFTPFKAEIPGRNRELSTQLRAYLDSPQICEKTDDDKTLLLAKRMPVP